MNHKLKEILLGIGLAVLTMLFMIGLLPWELISSLLGCVVAMVAVWRIRKRKNAGETVVHFTVSYIAVIIIAMLLLNSITISA